MYKRIVFLLIALPFFSAPVFAKQGDDSIDFLSHIQWQVNGSGERVIFLEGDFLDLKHGMNYELDGHGLGLKIDRLDERVNFMNELYLDKKNSTAMVTGIAFLSLLISSIMLMWSFLNYKLARRGSVYDHYWLREIVLPKINAAISSYTDTINNTFKGLSESPQSKLQVVFDASDLFIDEVKILSYLSDKTYKDIVSIGDVFSDSLNNAIVSGMVGSEGVAESDVYGGIDGDVFFDFKEESIIFTAKVISRLADFHYSFNGFPFKRSWWKKIIGSK